MNLNDLLEPTLLKMGYELVDIEQLSRNKLLRIFVDKKGGISVDDCVLISNHLEKLLAVENIDYSRLEVSSPGLDRRLKKETDFYRFIGARIKLKLYVAIQGQKNFEGVLVQVENGIVKLEVAGEVLDIKLNNLEKARLVPQF